MAERLAFNTGGFGHAGGAVDSLSTAARKVPRTVSEAAPFLPPIDVANWGFWGVFGSRPCSSSGRRTPSRRWRRSTFPRSSPSPRSSPWSRTGSAGGFRCCASREKRSASASWRCVMVAHGAVLGVARRRAGHIHRHLLQGRAGVPADGQQRQERQGAAWLTWLISERHGLRGGARRSRLRQRRQSRSRASGSTDRSPG